MRHAGKVLVLATGFAGFAGAAVPSYDSYKSWLVACDNGLTCEAKGFEDGTSNNPDLRFDRAAGPQAATEVTLNAPFSASLGDLRVDGKPLRLDAATWKVNSRADFSTLSTGRPAAVAALIAQLRNGSKLQVGKDASIPLDGMVAALLRMDDRQGREDSVTALIRKGPTAAASVPAPPRLCRSFRPATGEANWRPPKVID